MRASPPRKPCCPVIFTTVSHTSISPNHCRSVQLQAAESAALAVIPGSGKFVSWPKTAMWEVTAPSRKSVCHPQDSFPYQDWTTWRI